MLGGLELGGREVGSDSIAPEFYTSDWEAAVGGASGSIYDDRSSAQCHYDDYSEG